MIPSWTGSVQSCGCVTRMLSSIRYLNGSFAEYGHMIQIHSAEWQTQYSERQENKEISSIRKLISFFFQGPTASFTTDY